MTGYLLIPAIAIGGVVLLALVSVAFADADFRPIKLSNRGPEPDCADARPEARRHEAARPPAPRLQPSANDEEEPRDVVARRRGRSR